MLDERQTNRSLLDGRGIIFAEKKKITFARTKTTIFCCKCLAKTFSSGVFTRRKDYVEDLKQEKIVFSLQRILYKSLQDRKKMKEEIILSEF